MSTPAASRAAATPPHTLVDVLAAIAAAQLPERRKQDLASAVRSAARALGRPPEQVPADPRLLASRLTEIAPQALGFSKARWSNVRSLLRAALELAAPVAPGRHLTPLTPTWAALWDRLPTRRLKTRLSRLLHYCSAAGIEPHDIGEATFAAFREHLELTLLKEPPAVFRETLLGWNDARAQVSGWPDLTVRIPTRRTAWTLPWSAFPESLHQDLMRYLDRLGGRDPLEELPFRPVRPLTLRHREYQLRQFASALVMRGRDPSTLMRLADLVAIETFKDGLRYLLERRGWRSTATIVHLATSLKGIARHHVRVDAQHLERMAAVIGRLDPPKRGLTVKNRSRLRALDDPKTALALVRLPDKLMALADREQHPLRAARLAQTAVAIEILLMAPIRIGNPGRLDTDQHLIRPSRIGSALHIVIESSETKNREPLEYPLPSGSIELIERYLSQFRPALAPAGSTALFPGRSNGSKHGNSLRTQIADAVFAHTGMRVHPHLFRHIAAKLFLDANPGSYEVMRRVLGHRSLETTTAFYTGLETASAVRHFDQTILKLRKGGGRS
jgi:integrase